jgi:antitoxin ParD1/3/4
MISMPASIGFRPTLDDERILREAGRSGESTSDTLRRALRLLDHERWLAQFRADAEALKNEDINAEPEAW